jgi:hypothetical protein
MATKRQTAANRRNARRSKGPKTAQGKATASMNAVRHGLRARTVVLPRENQDDFDQIHAGLQGQYQPQTPSEQYLVDQAAIAQWKLVRLEVFEAACYDKDPSANACAAIFGRMTQFQCRLERSYFKAYQELERIKAARQKQPEQSKPEQSKQEEQSTAKQGKKDKFEHPPKLQVTWVDPGTGHREVLFRSENGIPVKEFTDGSGSSNPQDPPPTEPPTPPR